MTQTTKEIQKERIKLTRQSIISDIGDKCNNYHNIPNHYDKTYIEPFRIIRDNKIKNALRASLFNLLKAEQRDGSELLSSYVDINTTFDDYKYAVSRCYVWCGLATSYAPYENLIEGLEDDLNLLTRISDEAWEWITKINIEGHIFNKFKFIKDCAIVEYHTHTKDYRTNKNKLLEQAISLCGLYSHEKYCDINKLCKENSPIPSLTHLCLEAIKGKLLPFMEKYQYHEFIYELISDK